MRSTLALVLLAGSSFVSTTLAAALEPSARYDGHRVVTVHVSTLRDLNTVMALTDDPWTCGGMVLGSFDVRVSPAQYAQLVAHGIKHDVLIQNVQELIDDETIRLGNKGNAPDAGFFDDFHNYDEIKAYFQNLAATYPNLATYFVAGQSLEGRELFGLRISGPGNNPNRPAYFVQGTQHAREWGNTSCTVFHADALLTRYTTDPTVKDLVDKVEWIIIPIVNPDGYVYTWGPDRLWRKNRKNNGNGCFGVDTNRNWDWEWTGPGNSTNPCNETYRGTAPFSEPETQVIRDFVNANPKIKAGMDFHSFSQLVMWPWAWTDQLSPDEPTFQAIGQNMAAAIQSKYGKEYEIGPIYTTIYPAAGGAVDWMYGAHGILGFTIEVRDTGGYGFIMPASEIIPNAEENFAASLEIVKYIAQPLLYSLPSGIPTMIAPSTPASVDVSIKNGSGVINPATAQIHSRLGNTGPFAASPLSSLGGNLYQGSLPSVPCGEIVQFYFSATTNDNVQTTYPPEGPAAPFQTTAFVSADGYTDTLETNTNWVVGAPGDNATSGLWNRMDPQPTAAQPGDDHTPAPGVACWVTDGNAGSGVGSNDVDGGSTTLTSPTIDASGLSGDVYVSYWRWYSNDQGGSPNNDTMPVSISSDNGNSWTQLELVGENANAWVYKDFKLSALGVTPTSTMKLRFVARDLGQGSVVEAAVDDIKFFAIGCPSTGCYSDCDGDGALSIDDFICFQTLFALGDPTADCDGDTALTIDDFICFQTLFAIGC